MLAPCAGPLARVDPYLETQGVLIDRYQTLVCWSLSIPLPPSHLKWFLARLADPQDSVTLTPSTPGLLTSSGVHFYSVEPLSVSPGPHTLWYPQQEETKVNTPVWKLLKGDVVDPRA